MTLAHQFHPTVLREYDIRGIIGKTVNADDARAIGRGFGTQVVRQGGTKVAIGYDGRHSSPELEQAVVEGLKSTGLHVVRIGLGPTPMLYFTVRHLKLDAGLMITGSHNPPDYNGFKMMMGKAPVYGAQIQEIGTIAAAGDFATGEGSEETIDIQDAYVERLLQDYDGVRDLNVVWDNGNGAAGEILRRLVAKLPGKHTLLFDEIDGDFPNHHPDPTIPENLEDIIHKVKELGADLGIAFDGDADRIGAVDEKGRIVWGDQLVAIYAKDVLRSHPGATIIADVKASQTLFDQIAKCGGTPLMWKTGHSLLKAKMAETNSPLAGEMSGHIFFADKYYGYDDAPYCGVRLIGQVSREGTLSALRDELPEVLNTPEVRFQVSEERKFASVEEIKNRVKAAAAASGDEVNDIDGVRVKTKDGWWLLRASNTQDVLVARAEAYSAEGLTRLTSAIKAELAASGIAAPAGF
ncbi:MULTISPECIES: phosphoglucomutase/phosphomannomutase PgmG [unclassified Azospirillum]|uniref:phosphoglucomutase/phosphomannomutase PgmG n=1 Tax=unclassified Azospirillum TaxID=2630922 RepID=UPI000B6B7672|nr:MULTISPECIES: phosphomannomutase/phosphoglucomutase [unclassified Azospirillum]SNR87060.1 phosphomannomutase [Azospirillum sp. RU38E]SNS03278.1 phosphomannomutase [Azospirillum sp. RU37A]